MMSTPSRDPLVSLWQSSASLPTQNLLQDLERLHRLHQRQNRAVLSISIGIAALFIFEEATGRLAAHGVLSVSWIGVVVAGVLWKRRARCNRLDALTFDTVRLLNVMIARAKSDLFVARCLYAGVPLGATMSYVLLKLVGVQASKTAETAHSRIETLQTAVGVVALVLMTVTGVILARARRDQVRDLQEKLRATESDL